MTPREEANAAQRRASAPGVSAFVAASAGSGKTKLLTDRLLRLLLSGADPARIQCLTFTKAAAAEMALRLQRTLGRWVTLDNAGLDAALRALTVAPDEAVRRQARALFARVLDLPGGMRIGTIHAFCQSLLRRFPLEARLSPHFRLVDDTDAGIALTEAREAMLAEAHTPERRAALETLAGLVSAEGFGGLVEALQADRARLDRLLRAGPDAWQAAQRRVLGADGSAEALMAEAARPPGEPALLRAARLVAEQGAATVQARAEEILGWLSCDPADRAANWAEWTGAFLTRTGEPRAASGLVNAKLAKAHDGLAEPFLAEQRRVVEIEDRLRALRVAALSAALVTLAAPVARAYAAHKEGAGLLDYDDLIGRTAALLVDPGAAWVLYKLDGGLDHLLLDEVQDTAPAQWRIAGALTEEFFAGAGAREGEMARSVFAVGDRKQSIYSFQGADPDAFELWRDILRRRVGAAGLAWEDVALRVSFRSTAPVLALVDQVFADPLAAAGVTATGVTATGEMSHLPDRTGHAGSVELWPLAPLPPQEEPEPWVVPEANRGLVSAPQRLADALAAWIAGQTGGGVMLPSRGRALAPGDVLVLVRRRNAFARALVRALKARGVPVAGLDRLVLTEQPAVADLLALCDALLLPEDDLSLASVLTSPLGGLTDDSLMALATRRPGTLWAALRARAAERADWAAARDFIATLLARVDYVSPHALLAEALGPLGGRARLFARLGPDAAEPVDELLQAALTYARGHPPALQGFVQWLRQSGAEVKREAEGSGPGGGAVRIMTVHGAKGLQAPLVILPDTTALPPDEGAVAWAADAESGLEVPVWAPRRELRCAAVEALRAAAGRRRMEEHNRLLYVALTRAEDRLVVCGWQTGKTPAETCWYELVRRGMTALGAATPFDAVADGWEGEMWRHASPQVAAPEPDAARADAAAPAVLPGWAGAAPLWLAAPPPPEPALPAHLAPSRPENAGLGGVPPAASPLSDRGLLARDAAGARFRRGQLVHALLQHLPALPAAARHVAALGFLQRPGQGVDDAEAVAGEVLAVLAHPALAPLFGPGGRAEVPLTGVVGDSVVGGLVDRLAVLDDRVLVADYKTNRAPPARVGEVPLLYLRQMAAYRAVLRQIFPGRAVACVLVWTVGGVVMPLPDSLLDSHAPGVRPAA
ncbi:MAG: double-strand break repair helicase AddA [Rhodospirillales bacterium 70-18]|nr:MAG: double-strand break repair helicase AddA [Rhodospirillales bacterium 70-18]